jgi:hypothetical protein
MIENLLIDVHLNLFGNISVRLILSGVSFSVSYFIKYVLQKTFQMQTYAELARDEMFLLLNNAPDLVILLSIKETKNEDKKDKELIVSLGEELPREEG